MQKTLRILPAVLLGLLLPHPASAYQLADSWNVLCGFIPCSSGGGGALGLNGYIYSKVIVAMESIFVAVVGTTLFLSAARMTLQSSDETAVSESRMAFIYAIGGAVVVGFASLIVQAFAPSATGTALVNTGLLIEGVNNIIIYIRLVLGTLVLVNIVVQAFRLIASHGEDEQFEKAKTYLIAGIVGAGIVMLANAVMISVNPEIGGPTDLAIEMAGIANYIITLFGFGCVLVLIGAGAFLALSTNDGGKEKAKNMVLTAIVGLLAVLISFALVNAFIFLGNQ